MLKNPCAGQGVMQLEEKMDLLLVQHGQAKTKAEDPAKPLSALGVESAEKMAEWLFKAGVTFCSWPKRAYWISIKWK